MGERRGEVAQVGAGMILSKWAGLGRAVSYE